MSVGTSASPSDPDVFCKSVNAFRVQERAALLLAQGQRDAYLAVARANLAEVEKGVRDDVRDRVAPYFAAWRVFFERVGRGDRNGAPVPIYDPAVAQSREAWKLVAASCAEDG